MDIFSLKMTIDTTDIGKAEKDIKAMDAVVQKFNKIVKTFGDEATESAGKGAKKVKGLVEAMSRSTATMAGTLENYAHKLKMIQQAEDSGVVSSDKAMLARENINAKMTASIGRLANRIKKRYDDEEKHANRISAQIHALNQQDIISENSVAGNAENSARKQILAKSQVLASLTNFRMSMKAQKADALALAAENRKLEASYNKLAKGMYTADAVMMQYNRNLMELEKVRVYKNLAVDSHEYAAMLNEINVKKELGLQRAKAYNTQLQLTGKNAEFSRHHLVNLGYQLQDVIIGLQMGQNPMTIFIQQGTQMAGIAASAGVSLGHMAKAMATMVANIAKSALFNPWILALTTISGLIIRVNQNLSRGSETELKNYARSLGLTTKEVNRLNDVHVTFMDNLQGFFKALGEQIGIGKEWYKDLTSSVGSGFDWLLTKSRNIFVGLYAIFSGTFNSMIYTLHQLPYMIGDAFMMGVNGAIKSLEWFANKGVDAINYVGGSLEHLKFGQLANPFRGEIRGIVDVFMEEGGKAQDAANKFIDTMIENTKKYGKEVAKARVEKQALKILEERTDNSAENRKAILDKIILGLQNQANEYANVIKYGQDYVDIQKQIGDINERLVGAKKAQLDPKTEEPELKLLMKRVQAEQKSLKVYQEVNSAKLARREAIKGLDAAYVKGIITKEQYFAQLIKVRAEYATATNPLKSLTDATMLNNQAVDSGNKVLEDQIALLQMRKQIQEGGQASTLSDDEIKNAIVANRLANERVDVYKEMYSDTNALAQAERKLLTIQEAYDNKKIDFGTYSKGIKATNQEIIKMRLAMGGGTANDSLMAMVYQFGDGFTNVLDGLTTSFGNFFAGLRDGFANSIGQAIVDGKSLKDSFGDIVKSISRDMISSLAKLAVQYWVVGENAAIAGVASQALGDPYTAFTRMAAMAAIMAGLGFVTGSIGGGKGGVATTDRLTGTVLGFSDKESESIKNAVEITADATSALVGINRRMLTAMSSLSDALSGVSDILVRQGVGAATGGISSGLSSTQSGLVAGGIMGATAMSMGFGALMSSGIAGFYGLAAIAVDKLLNGLISSIATSIVNVINKIPVIGSLTSSLFGSMQVTEVGLRIADATFAELMNGVNAWTYQHASSSGLFGGSSDATQALSTEASNQIALIFSSMGNTILEAANVLGMDVDLINQKFSEWSLGGTITIALKDLDADEQAEAINAVFSNIFDSVASYVAGEYLGQFQKAGEGMAETLVRVATNVLYVDEYFNRLGINIKSLAQKAGADLAEVATRLVELAGDYQTLSELQSTFLSKFYDEAEQFAVLSGDLTRVLDSMGLSLPETRAMWRDLVNSIDVTNESGAQAYITLLNLSDAADSYYSYLEDAADELAEKAQELLSKLQTATDYGMSALEKAIEVQKGLIEEQYQTQTDALNKLLDASNERVDSLTDVYGKLNDALNDMIQGGTSNLGVMRKSAQARLAEYIDVLRAGGLVDSDELGNTLSVLGEDSKGLYKSFEEYATDYWVTANQIKEATGLAGDSLSIEEQMVANLEEQIQQVEAWRDAEIAKLDATLAYWQQQIDISRGTYVATMSVVDAVAQLSGLLSAEKSIATSTTPPTSYGNSTIEAMYQQYLGRSSDVAGMAYWTALYDAGTLSLSQIENFIANSDEALNGSHAGGLGTVPFDGYRAELHKNEMVLPASVANNVRNMTGEEITAVKEELMKNNALTKTLIDEVRQTRKINDRWDKDGMPEVRAV